MNEKPENPPAFPQTIDDMGTLTVRTQGMSLRDYFAAKAMQGDMASQAEGYHTVMSEDSDERLLELSKLYYRIADAMLEARSKQP